MSFTEHSIWTMVHGIGLGGAALMGLTGALFYLYATRTSPVALPPASRALAAITVFTAVMLWLTVLVGTYIIFPPYRATPPAGTVDLSQFPRSLIQANADTAWLHAFATESKHRLLGDVAAVDQAELRWHLAQMLPRLELSGREERKVVAILLRFLDDNNRIVKTSTMQPLPISPAHPAPPSVSSRC